MQAQAEAKQKELDTARVQFAQRLASRDERQKALELIAEQEEKLKWMHKDPETPKVLLVGLAPEPLEVSSPKWQFYFPGGVILGLMAGA
ncbi:MAG: hypothetical protein ACYS29_15125, partial [Planctomycetota bacterium]